MARPSKLDDLVAQRIVAAVKSGLPRTHAARLARISPATLFDWLARGRRGEPGYAELLERVAEAEAHDVAELVGFMREHAKVSHAACAWLLERRFPKAFALRRPAADTATPADAERFARMTDSELREARLRLSESIEAEMSSEELELKCQNLKARIARKAANE